MTKLINKIFSLPFPQNLKYLIFSDLDETYLPWTSSFESFKHIQALENLFIEKKNNIMLIWVTGSTFQQVLYKINLHKILLVPHYVACSLGTEIWYFHNNKNIWKMDREWNNIMINFTYSFENIKKLINDLDYLRIKLIPQPVNRCSRYKQSYYYFSQEKLTEKIDIFKIKKLANSSNLCVNISKCNLKIDNFENGYDVDFTPHRTGKHHIVKYFLNKYNLTKDSAYAFGDSGNDIKMLKFVKHGYLVQNATIEAKKKYKNVAEHSYSQGILSVLTKNLDI